MATFRLKDSTQSCSADTQTPGSKVERYGKNGSKKTGEHTAAKPCSFAGKATEVSSMGRPGGLPGSHNRKGVL